MQLCMCYKNQAGMIRFFIAGLILVVSGCASLPTDVQRTESFALVETSGTALCRRYHLLAGAGHSPRLQTTGVFEIDGQHPFGRGSPVTGRQ